MVFFNLLLAVLASLMRFQLGGAPDGQGPGSGDGDGSGTAVQTPPATPPAPAPINPDTKDNAPKFTQADVDRVVKERLERERGKYSDYDDLKKKAEAFEKLEEGQKSELQRAQEAKEKAEREAAQRIELANTRLRASAILAAIAGKVNPKSLDLVVDHLLKNDEIKVEDDGKVSGVEKAVEAFLKENDYLLAKATPGQSGAEFGGREQKTLAEQITEAESKGDWRTANMLKMQQMRQGGGSQA